VGPDWDITSVTKHDIAKLPTITLFVAGSPCNDLSILKVRLLFYHNSNHADMLWCTTERQRGIGRQSKQVVLRVREDFEVVQRAASERNTVFLVRERREYAAERQGRDFELLGSRACEDWYDT
jgi:site-specific DNA-cytosine methylase